MFHNPPPFVVLLVVLLLLALLFRKRSPPVITSGLPFGAKQSRFESLLTVIAAFHAATSKSGRVSDDDDLLIIETTDAIEGLEIIDSIEKNSFFNHQFHPRVQGNEWYRGYHITTAGMPGSILIFLHCLSSERAVIPKAPLVYTIGDVSDEEVLSVVKRFFHYLEEKSRTLSPHDYIETMVSRNNKFTV